MTGQAEHTLQTRFLPLLTPGLAALVTLFGGLVLAGWAADSLLIARINARYIPMAPASAGCFVLLGTCMLLRHFWPARPGLNRLRQGLAAGVLLFSMIILLQFALATFFGLALDIEKWFVAASLSAQGYLVGRMSPLTAVLFMLLCINALLASPERRASPLRQRLAHTAADIAFVLAGFLIVGYLYGAPLLYGGGIIPVALTTAGGLFILSAAGLLEVPDGSFIRWMASRTVLARITRRILPGTVLLFLFLEWLQIRFLAEIPASYVTLSRAMGALLTAGFIALTTLLTARQIQASLTQAGRDLRLSEDKFRNLFNNSQVGIWRTRLDGSEILDINDKFLEIFGYTRLELQGAPSVLQWADPNERQELLRRLAAEGQVTDFECGMLDKQGQLRNCLTSVRLYPQEAILEGSLIDITERKRAEARLAQLAAIVDSSEDAIIGKSLEGQITSWNTGAEHLYGYSAGEVIGRSISILMPDDRTDEFPNILARLKRGESISNFESMRLRKDGALLNVSITISPIKDASGQIVGAASVARDISDLKRAELELKAYSEHLVEMVAERTRELREAHEKLLRQERLATLGQLAGSVGHELRNPLGVISNAVYYLKMTQPDANATILEYLDIIDKETRSSDKIVTDLLDFTRTKSVERASAAVPDLVRQTLERYPVPASIEVALGLPADLPSIFVDPQQIVQVLGNLVTNACQAMPLEAGKLTLSARLHGDMIAIAVQDSGVGIPPENMGKLFEPLFTTRTKGIGLGLAVSQKLTEANGGRIEVTSELGKGSTFTVYLPVVKEEQ